VDRKAATKDGGGVDSPETWRWIWLAVALVFAIGEMAAAGTFFLAPFAAGAVVAAILAFADVEIGWQWVAFAVVSAATFLALRPLARRLDRQFGDSAVGAERYRGREATVLEAIPRGLDAIGLVRVEREEWRAQSTDGSPIAAGSVVRIVRMEGTRVIVEPISS
jgi:membrane protein implicated in regulation of membrane protease activity